MAAHFRDGSFNSTAQPDFRLLKLLFNEDDFLNSSMQEFIIIKNITVIP
jgi:hypothetical protein